MGIYSPEPSPGYGRFRFEAERVNKWNCVFRVRQPKGIEKREFRYRLLVFVGTLADVQRDMKALVKAPGRK